eukprot:2856647-Pleurochrysis_carterae.AAC.1
MDLANLKDDAMQRAFFLNGGWRCELLRVLFYVIAEDVTTAGYFSVLVLPSWLDSVLGEASAWP